MRKNSGFGKWRLLAAASCVLGMLLAFAPNLVVSQSAPEPEKNEQLALDLYRGGAKAFRTWGGLQAADSLFRLAYQMAATESLKVKALYMVARCTKHLGDENQAKKAYMEVFRLFPHSYLADDALFQVACDIDSSIVLYRKFLKRFPKSEHAPGALFRLAVNLHINAKKRVPKGAQRTQTSAIPLPKER